jgi:ornithine decarboxylase
MENFSEVTQLLSTEKITYFEKTNSILDIIQAMLERTQYDSGFFIVDLSTVIGQYELWVNLLPRVRPFYAVKSNPNPTIIKTLAILGAGFDCASKNEIKQVLEIVNNDSSRIIFANPAKSDSHLRYARNMDVDLMTFDNEFELLKIAHIHPAAQLVLRIKVDDSYSMCRFNSKFGADPEDVDRLMKFARMLELDVVGVSFHVGSGCTDVKAFDIAIGRARNVFDIGRENGYSLNLLDIGGGFPGTETATGLSFAAFAEQINISLDKYFPVSGDGLENLRIIAEPGRYFCSASHTLILNVIAKRKRFNKDSGEVNYSYTLNDGIYGSMNCIMFDHAKPKIKPFNEREGKTYRCVVYGPTCDSVDVISESCDLPDLAIGECVYIEDCGAYTTAAASQFNGFHLTPCEYILRN